MKVYLAGCKGDWREKLKLEFIKWDFYDPFINSNQECIANFTYEDLYVGIKPRDLMIIRIGYPCYTGACIEAGFAKALRIPIILIWCLGGRLDSMLAGISSYIFLDDETATQFIKDRMYKK